MITCSTCGADPAASTFCHECGTSPARAVDDRSIRSAHETLAAFRSVGSPYHLAPTVVAAG